MQFHQFVFSRGQQAKFASRVFAALAVLLGFTAALPASAAAPAAAPAAAATPAPVTTLDRIKGTGHIKLGYIDDARPFTHSPAPGNVQGYSARLCQQIAERVKVQLNLSQLVVDWVAVKPADHVNEVKQGNIDLLCTPTSETAAKRQDVAYSKPVFPGGVRAIVSKNTAAALREALGENPKPKPVWRGSPAAKVLDKGSFAVMAGTTTERWLASKKATLQINATTVPVPDYRTGLQQLMDGKVDVFFGDRAVAIGAVDDLGVASEALTILPRWFTHEPLSLALPRNDDDFRLVVDRALSDAYAAVDFEEQYSKWNGPMDDKTFTFFQWVSFAP